MASGAEYYGGRSKAVSLTNADINIRDPFVVPVPAERRYYLYGTRGAETWGATKATGLDVYVGTDLENWDGPRLAFDPPAGFWSDRNFWAPEVHAYRGAYYMFATFKAEGVCRGTQILRADAPVGPFTPHSPRPVTPADRECLDGTLFVDDDGAPWMVFCHEWVQITDGAMCAMPLSDDLTSAAGDPVDLFHASDAPWARPMGKNKDAYVTDGPFLLRADGALLMLWASHGAAGYAQGVASSASGNVLGPWEQVAEPLYAEDGGHGMVFETFDGRLMLTLHKPNGREQERPVFVPLEIGGGTIRLASE